MSRRVTQPKITPMRAAILAVGTELLGSDRVDTNSLELAALLARYGVSVGAKAVVGDDRSAICAAAQHLLQDHGLLLVSGGLGPTQDDLTREALAELVCRPLVRDERVLEGLKLKFARFGMEMPAVNAKQADVVEGAEVLENGRGTAPGLKIDHGGATLFVFPGVPHELHGLAESSLVPWLERNTSGSRLETQVLKVACVPESTLEQRLLPFYDRWGDDGVALLPSAGEVTIRLSCRGTDEERAAWLEPRRQALRAMLDRSVFTEIAGDSLEEATAGLLVRAGLTISTAESCTGGLIAERLTRVVGSSAYFIGCVVSYADSVKRDVLGVGAVLLRDHGAVSEAVARAMAGGVRRSIPADLAIAVTGIAGPGGGSQEKPVGTVHVALSGPGDDETAHRLLQIPGDRERVRWITSQWALEMVRRRLLQIGGEGDG